MDSRVAQAAQLFSAPPAAGSPARPAVDVASLQPGDVLIFGVYAGECEERLCSDVVSCLNVLGQALYSGRFAGVPAAWACHVAIYAGDVTESGRVEMLPFLREQAISITAHRFGTPHRLAYEFGDLGPSAG